MKKAHAGRVPVLESAFELKLPFLLKQAKAMGANTLVITDGAVRTVVELTPTRLATKLGGRVWLVDIVPVPCLKGRVRPLLKCPRAHEGNFQALYFKSGVLACRHCHELRYRSNLAGNSVERSRYAMRKLTQKVGGTQHGLVPKKNAGEWQKRHVRTVRRLLHLQAIHYRAMRNRLLPRTAIGFPVENEL